MIIVVIPYIGVYSDNTPNIYVATGFNKWGMEDFNKKQKNMLNSK